MPEDLDLSGSDVMLMTHQSLADFMPVRHALTRASLSFLLILAM